MIKRKIDDYIRNYYETNRNALLITGARQIGKTYSIRQFGKTFKSFIEVNFVEMPEAVDLFKGAKSSGDILLRLSAITSVPLIKGETLVFFDEVQQCPDIVTAIKFLVDDGSYRYILRFCCCVIIFRWMNRFYGRHWLFCLLLQEILLYSVPLLI